MSLRKYILLVDEHGGSLAELAPKLKEFGFKVGLVTEPSMLIETIRNVRKLALVVINGQLVEEGANDLVASVKALHPELPILFSGIAEAPVEFKSHRPDVLFVGPFPSKRINDFAMELLRESLYPTALVEGLQRITAEMLAGFGKFKLSDEPFLKASRTLLLPVNAMIPLSGSDHMAGHLIVSAREEVLRAVYREMFQLDAPSVEALEDMTGEIANMLAGGLKSLIEKKGTSLFIGVPTFIRGSMISFRRGLLTPSLSLGAIHSSNQGGMAAGEDLFVELTFERIDPTLFDRKEEVAQVGDDELTFL